MSPYPVSEDTLLLLDYVPCRGRILDMGTGNGSFALKCARKGNEVVAVDIEPEAVNYVRSMASREGLNIKVILSDLFENVDGKFDTITFNPPYLPGEAKEIEDLQWAGGGEYGDEVIMKFLGEVSNHMKDDARVYIILSSFNRIDEIKKFPFSFKLIAEKKLSFHKICLYELAKKI
jgi:release factor glutamine methyltransferase